MHIREYNNEMTFFTTHDIAKMIKTLIKIILKICIIFKNNKINADHILKSTDNILYPRLTVLKAILMIIIS